MRCLRNSDGSTFDYRTTDVITTQCVDGSFCCGQANTSCCDQGLGTHIANIIATGIPASSTTLVASTFASSGTVNVGLSSIASVASSAIASSILSGISLVGGTSSTLSATTRAGSLSQIETLQTAFSSKATASLATAGLSQPSALSGYQASTASTTVASTNIGSVTTTFPPGGSISSDSGASDTSSKRTEIEIGVGAGVGALVLASAAAAAFALYRRAVTRRMLKLYPPNAVEVCGVLNSDNKSQSLMLEQSGGTQLSELQVLPKYHETYGARAECTAELGGEPVAEAIMLQAMQDGRNHSQPYHELEDTGQ